MTPEEIAEVEERARPIADAIRTQDNAITAHPYFIVYEGNPDSQPKWWTFVHAFFTRAEAEAFIEGRRYDLRRAFVWVASAHNNHEIRAARQAFADVPALVAEVRRLRAMMPHPSWDDDAAGFIARLRDIATNTRLRCPKDKDESCATCHEAGEMLGVLEMLDAEREAVAALRLERNDALAEVARLREALDAAARVVKRKADREAGREET